MKKILSIILIGFIIILFPTIIEGKEVTLKNHEFVSEYESWDLDLSKEELERYYIDNNIFPGNAPSGSENKLNQGDVASHLLGRFPQYTGWSSLSNSDVAEIYGGNPPEIYEYDSYVQTAKNNAGITYSAIGCGPLSMLSQFEFLYKYAGYSSLSPTMNNNINDILLATEIFENTDTIPHESILGQITGATSGTFTFPGTVITSSKEILEKKYLSVPKTKEVIDDEGNITTKTYYDADTQIVVSGDSVPSLSSFATKKNQLIDSIDKGMPVIWWTLSGAGDFDNHYMNIFGYEYWAGIDSSGNRKVHLMFKLNYNWGDPVVYMDSDVLDAVNGGFIFFEENGEKSLIKADDFDSFACQYFYDDKTEYITTSEDNSTIFRTKRKRTGYVNRYDSTNTIIESKHLVLSAKRENAGIAYLEYKFNNYIDWIYLETSWWSGMEGISSFNGDALIQYKDYNNQWITQFDLQSDIPLPELNLSTIMEYPSQIKVEFEYPIKEFRIYVETDYPTGTRNKGRLVIQDLNVFYAEDIEPYYVYEPYDKDVHKRIDAVTGTFTYQPHAVKSSSGRFTNCVVCGQSLDLSLDGPFIVQFAPGVNNNNPNLIMLSKNEFELYMKGKLDIKLLKKTYKA